MSSSTIDGDISIEVDNLGGVGLDHGVLGAGLGSLSLGWPLLAAAADAVVKRP